MEKIILFMDNILTFLDVYTALLEESGYKVLKASSLEEAEEKLKEERVHLAVLDIRMMDENDKYDVSGLVLAQKEEYRYLPKIMLTAHPSADYVREAMRFTPDNIPPAIAFLYKVNASKELIEAVDRAFDQFVRINSDLIIQRNERNATSFHHLVTLVEPGLEGRRLLNRAKELEDLLRRLFYEKRQIKIDRMLWQSDRRLALTIFAFRENAVPESFVVVCGKKSDVVEERHRYKTFAPRALGGTGTALCAQAETMHFAANSYALAGMDLENLYTLRELFRTGPERAFNAAVNNLLEQTLRVWHQDRYIREETKTLDEVYRKRLAWAGDGISRSAFDECVQAIVNQIPMLGPKVERISGRLTLRFYGQSCSYLDPTPILYRRSDIGQPVLLMNTPGTLSDDNILADANGRTWLTDFGDAGLAPPLWNYVTLEAAIRFDWVQTNNLQALHEMEQCLLVSAFNKLDTRDIDPPLRRPLRAIQVIRRLASGMVGNDMMPYHLGILFHAASRLVSFNPAFQLTSKELTRLAHVLIAAAMICSKIEQDKQSLAVGTVSTMRGIHIDQANRTAWVDGVRVPLPGQSYDLLCDLYEHANQLCTRRELVERVFGQKYDGTDESQISRLNTAIRRLRERIEDDPNHPRYLLTEAVGGYRLVARPSE